MVNIIGGTISMAKLYVRTRFDLNPKTGTDPGSHSPNNEFIECRKES